MTPLRLTKAELHIINEALALLEAEVESDDRFTPAALPRLRKVRARVHDLIDATRGGYNPALGLPERKIG